MGSFLTVEPRLLTLDELRNLTPELLEERVAATRQMADAALAQDLRIWVQGSTEHMKHALNVGWDVIVLCVTERAQVSEVIEQVRAEHRAGKAHFPSDSALYRTTGPLQRVIQHRANLDRTATKSFLKQNLHLLLLVRRDELEDLALRFPSKRLFADAFPVPKRPQPGNQGDGPKAKPDAVDRIVRQARFASLASAKLLALITEANRTNGPLPEGLGEIVADVVRASRKALEQVKH